MWGAQVAKGQPRKDTQAEQLQSGIQPWASHSSSGKPLYIDIKNGLMTLDGNLVKQMEAFDFV